MLSRVLRVRLCCRDESLLFTQVREEEEEEETEEDGLEFEKENRKNFKFFEKKP